MGYALTKQSNYQRTRSQTSVNASRHTSGAPYKSRKNKVNNTGDVDNNNARNSLCCCCCVVIVTLSDAIDGDDAVDVVVAGAAVDVASIDSTRSSSNAHRAF